MKSTEDWLSISMDASSGTSGWWCFPPRGVPRWILPTDPASWSASSELISGNLKKRLFRGLFLFRSLFKHSPDKGKSGLPAPIDHWLEGIWEHPPNSFAIYRGTPSIFCKDTVQCQDHRGRAIGYLKIARATHSSASIHNEARILSLLSSKLPDATFFPKILKLDDGISLQSPPPLELTSLPQTVAAKSILLILKESFYQLIPAIESPSLILLQDCATFLQKQGHQQWADTLSQQKTILSEALGPQPIPHWLSHGDFVPWNLRGSFAFDWEWARDDLPWQDALHYQWFPLLSRRRGCSFTDLRNAWMNFASQLPTHQNQAPPPSDPIWGRAYLAQRLAFYSKSAIENRDDPASFPFLVRMHQILQKMS